jgi:tetratricopeptide (TPR) repeat protein
VKETNPKLKSLVTRALAIDDAQPEGHALLGGFYDDSWEWDAAEQEFRRALELNPNNARTYVLYSMHLEFLGKIDEALKNLQKAIELDPMNMNGLDNLAEAYIYAREFDKSIEQSTKTLEIEPTFANAHFHLAQAYFRVKKYDLWLEEWEKGTRFNNDPDELARVEAAKHEYPKTGYRGALKRAVTLQEEQAKRIYVDPAWIAAGHAELGETELAFAWLEKAYEEKSRFLTYIKASLSFDSVRSDPRYANLLRRMGLPQ